MRGVKESILFLTPIFLTFVATHVFIIIYAFSQHASSFPQIITATKADIGSTISQVGLFGMLFMIMRAYSMGAGTYTGIEAVSNGIPVLREVKEENIEDISIRTGKVYLFIMALIFLVKYDLDNVTLAAAEIGPSMGLLQIKSALLGLLIVGGMLIPGNIPNIICAGKLKIKSSE